MGFINLKKFIQMKYNLNYFMRNLFLVFEVWAAYIKFCQIIMIHLYYFYLNLMKYLPNLAFNSNFRIDMMPLNRLST